MSISGNYCQHAGACGCGGNEGQSSRPNSPLENKVQNIAQGPNGIDGKPYDCSSNGAGIGTNNKRHVSKRKKGGSGETTANSAGKVGAGENEPRVVDVQRIDTRGSTTIILIRKNS